MNREDKADLIISKLEKIEKVRRSEFSVKSFNN